MTLRSCGRCANLAWSHWLGTRSRDDSEGLWYRFLVVFVYWWKGPLGSNLVSRPYLGRLALSYFGRATRSYLGRSHSAISCLCHSILFYSGHSALSWKGPLGPILAGPLGHVLDWTLGPIFTRLCLGWATRPYFHLTMGHSTKSWHGLLGPKRSL